MQEQKNRVEVEGNNLHFPLFWTIQNANYSPEPRLCSFVPAQFETSPLDIALRRTFASPLWRKDTRNDSSIEAFAVCFYVCVFTQKQWRNSVFKWLKYAPTIQWLTSFALPAVEVFNTRHNYWFTGMPQLLWTAKRSDNCWITLTDFSDYSGGIPGIFPESSVKC